MQTCSSLFTLKLKVETSKFFFSAALITNKIQRSETEIVEIISQINIKGYGVFRTLFIMIVQYICSEPNFGQNMFVCVCDTI